MSTLKEAFKHQIENTRLLIEDDFGPTDAVYPVVWNGVIFSPSGNFYSSGREMKAGEKLLIAYLSEFSDTPTPLLFEESELELFEGRYLVIRVSDNVPVLKRSTEYMIYRLNELCYLEKDDCEEAESIRDQLDFEIKAMSEEDYIAFRHYSAKVAAEWELTKCLKDEINKEIDQEVLNELKGE